MSADSPNSVFISSDGRAIDLIASWLQQQGMDIEVVQQAQDLTTSDSLGLASVSDSSEVQLEILIQDEAQVDQARQLILRHQKEILKQAKLVDLQPAEVIVECEDCQRNCVFPGELAGTVQECDHCGSYLDVPGDDDEFDWSIVDETISEDEMTDQQDEESDAWG